MAAFLDSLPPVLRRTITATWGVIFIGVVFVLLPREAAELNDQLDWPRWQVPIAKIVGVGLFAGGLGLSLYCSRLFARIGKGTPIPFDPPKELVATGLYRVTRNPIYVAQVAILISYFLYFGQLALMAHAAAWALLVEGWVVWVEEPELRRRFGAAYVGYTQEVPRWIGIPSRNRNRAV
jgi:protein-S-isoprenylcysteine O-methyltransferase Ste14